jgi:hypothetical protein
MELFLGVMNTMQTLVFIGSPTSLQLSTNKYKKPTELLPFQKDQTISKYL